jgi:hypothetical protein
VRELIFQKQGEIRERYRGGRDREKKRLFTRYILNKNDFFKIERDIFQKRFFKIIFLFKIKHHTHTYCCVLFL